jgi:hypothetical protein
MKRTAAWALVLASASLFVERLVPPASSAPEPRAVAAETPDQTQPAVAAVDREVERLRDRLDTVPEIPAPKRDPFTFGRTPERPRSSVPTPEMLAPDIPPQPALPRLVAILSATENGAPERTAVIALGDDVQFKRAGDEIGAYVVQSVGADELVLIDPATQTPHSVPLH